MTTKHDQSDHHTSAATHHNQAAKSHREASKHFETGKDREHWAHQALVAHGHTLKAVASSDAARAHYAGHNGNMPVSPASVLPFPANALETAEAMGTLLQGSQQHAVAADHHEQAARHHIQACRYCGEKNYVPAAQEAELARRHAEKSLFHSFEATKQPLAVRLENDPPVDPGIDQRAQATTGSRRS